MTLNLEVNNFIPFSQPVFIGYLDMLCRELTNKELTDNKFPVDLELESVVSRNEPWTYSNYWGVKKKMLDLNFLTPKTIWL